MQMKRKRQLQRELHDNARIDDCACRFGIVGDQTRLKICYLLCHYPELSVSEMATVLDAPISTVSHSLKKLKEIHTVVRRREAKEVFYALSHHPFAQLVKRQLFQTV